MTASDREFEVDFEPLGRRARVTAGTTVLEAAQIAGVGLNAVCGGAGTCGTCAVRIVDGEVETIDDSDCAAIGPNLRLACATRVLGDVRVEVPPASMSAPQRAQVEGRERPVALEPAVRGLAVAVEPPGLSDLRGDLRRLLDALERQHGASIDRVDLATTVELPVVARESGWRLTAAIKDGALVALLPSSARALGLAVDVGTTKLAGYLIDLSSGEMLAASGAMNPQIADGEDVMSRIAHATESDAAARRLHDALADGLNRLVAELCAAAGASSRAIVDAVLVGNTCMHHLALGLPTATLGVAPYVPVVTEACDVRAADLGLRLASGAEVHLAPNIAGFVGGDHVAMVLAAGIHDAAGVTVGLDIGTNTEIVLAAGGRMICCSCASGPAFEGAHIRDGMRAAPGAVERIRLAAALGGPPRVEYQTIDGAPPVGICGSGILDAVAELLRAGVLNRQGAMVDGSHPRLRRTAGGGEFVLVPAGERGAPRDVGVTRGDVNEVQLAKGAIRAGLEVLLQEAGVPAAEVERVVVAGAFGSYLDVDSAMAIGMFPRLPPERFEQVGNAAGMGAKRMLVSRTDRAAARAIAAAADYVELATDPRFVAAYTEALMLPTADG